MASIHYNGVVYQSRPDETLLKMFLRQGVTVPYSCGGGSCHVCMHRCVEGTVPDRARRGLRAVLQQHDFFLLCRCVPGGDMKIELPLDEQRFTRAEVVQLYPSAGSMWRICVMPMSELFVSVGQGFSLHLPGVDPLAASVESVNEAEGSFDLGFGLPGDDALGQTLSTGMELELQGPFSQELEKPQAGIDMEAGLERPFPAPDPGLWRDLDDGALLSRILEVFYERVFTDPLLAPYFENATRGRLAEKQYNFLCQAITGEKVYFGERPRNAHHWMVIPGNVFDHRADILRDVLSEFAVPPQAAERLMAIEEYYRQDIVKERPWNKVLFGRVLPLEGYEGIVLEDACLCDGCEGEVDRGEHAIYHVRTGKLYCSDCRSH